MVNYMVRLFVGLSLPEEISRELSELKVKLSHARWLDSSVYHITLLFLGECDESEIELISDQLSLIEWVSFDCKVRGVGFFKQGRTARSLWAKVEGLEKDQSFTIFDLHQDIKEHLSPLEIVEESNLKGKRFIPHITLARLRPRSIELINPFMQSFSGYESLRFNVLNFHLYHSKLSADGAKYTKIKSFNALDS